MSYSGDKRNNDESEESEGCYSVNDVSVGGNDDGGSVRFSTQQRRNQQPGTERDSRPYHSRRSGASALDSARGKDLFEYQQHKLAFALGGPGEGGRGQAGSP